MSASRARCIALQQSSRAWHRTSRIHPYKDKCGRFPVAAPLVQGQQSAMSQCRACEIQAPQTSLQARADRMAGFDLLRNEQTNTNWLAIPMSNETRLPLLDRRKLIERYKLLLETIGQHVRKCVNAPPRANGDLWCVRKKPGNANHDGQVPIMPVFNPPARR